MFDLIKRARVIYEGRDQGKRCVLPSFKSPTSHFLNVMQTVAPSGSNNEEQTSTCTCIFIINGQHEAATVFLSTWSAFAPRRYTNLHQREVTAVSFKRLFFYYAVLPYGATVLLCSDRFRNPSVWMSVEVSGLCPHSSPFSREQLFLQIFIQSMLKVMANNRIPSVQPPYMPHSILSACKESSTYFYHGPS